MSSVCGNLGVKSEIDLCTPRELERALFAVATLFLAVGAEICTWACAYRRPESRIAVGPFRYLRHPRHLGDFIYAIGLGCLAPLWGFVAPG